MYGCEDGMSLGLWTISFACAVFIASSGTLSHELYIFSFTLCIGCFLFVLMTSLDAKSCKLLGIYYECFLVYVTFYNALIPGPDNVRQYWSTTFPLALVKELATIKSGLYL